MFGRGCTMRSNASWVTVTWDPHEQQRYRHERKHNLPATSLAGSNQQGTTWLVDPILKDSFTTRHLYNETSQSKYFSKKFMYILFHLVTDYLRCPKLFMRKPSVPLNKQILHKFSVLSSHYSRDSKKIFLQVNLREWYFYVTREACQYSSPFGILCVS